MRYAVEASLAAFTSDARVLLKSRPGTRGPCNERVLAASVSQYSLLPLLQEYESAVALLAKQLAADPPRQEACSGLKRIVNLSSKGSTKPRT